MKKLRCISCSEEWYINDGKMDKLKVCPFCASTIWKEKEKPVFDKLDSLDKAIYTAVTYTEMDTLKNPNTLISYLMDMAPGLKKEVRILSKALNEECMIQIKSAFEQDEKNVEIILNKLHYLFVEDEGLSDDWADRLCEGIYGAVMLAKEETEQVVITAEVEDIIEFPVQNTQGMRQITDDNDLNFEILSSSLNMEKIIEEAPDSIKESLAAGWTYECRGEFQMARKYYLDIGNRMYEPVYIYVAYFWYSKEKNYRSTWKWLLKAAEAKDEEIRKKGQILLADFARLEVGIRVFDVKSRR